MNLSTANCVRLAHFESPPPEGEPMVLHTLTLRVRSHLDSEKLLELLTPEIKEAVARADDDMRLVEIKKN